MSDKDAEAIFYRGFAAGIACLARDHGHPSMALDIMHLNGIDLDDLVAAEVDPFDLDPLREVWATRPRARSPGSSSGPGDTATKGESRG